ncbi:MSCRAMM family protein [Carnobacterium divergens]|nr:SpaA isopeptide-forming pilin-related protein [Carnobacterium divergens]MDT2012954.1 SpaA isopeptide-forming pilin-related protein [Carnobacterium divergens]
MKKFFSILMILFVLLSQVFSLKDIVFSEENQPKVPYLSFKVNPNPIGSMQLVSLNIGIDSSFGELPNPSKICFDIPSLLIRQSSDFQNQQLPDYLTWLSTENDGDNTHICYELDTTGQQYFTFSIQFTSAMLLEGTVDPSYDFTATLNDTVISKDTVMIHPGTTGDPHFAKFRKFATDPVDGLGLLDLNYPNYNMYELVFNRDFSGEFQDVVIQDQLAKGTQLDASFPGWSEIPGNRGVSVNGLRVYQIDGSVPIGQENRKYVTEEFLDAIAYDDKAEAFKVDLGIVPQNMSYVVQYAVEVTDGSLGTYTNTATLTKEGSNTITKQSTEKIKSNGSGKGFFEKAVDKTEITLPDRDLTYNLKVGGVGYTLPAGTIFFDYLPEGVVFKGIKSDSNKTFELVSVEGNKVTFKTTKELVNYTENLFFDVSYEGNSFPETLNNTAYIEKDTGTYYSNTVSTLVKGNRSAILTKKDDINGQSLKGAHFDLYNQSNELIKEDLTTNENGIIMVDNLEIGIYHFIETVPPEGYILDETPIIVEILNSQVEPVQVVKTNKKMVGAVQLTKKDNLNEQSLKGAYFNLYNASDELVKEALITDENGLVAVDNLEPGVYQFVETKAPDGYLLDETPVVFEIIASQTEPVQVSKTNKKMLGEVILTKTADTNNGKKLEGAVFELKDSNGIVLKNQLSTNSQGELTVKDLEPGDYQFVETKAPKGYELDEMPIYFTIATNQTQTIRVNKVNKKSNTVENETSDDKTNSPNLPVDKNQANKQNQIPALGESPQSMLAFLGISTLFISIILIMGKKRVRK